MRPLDVAAALASRFVRRLMLPTSALRPRPLETREAITILPDEPTFAVEIERTPIVVHRP